MTTQTTKTRTKIPEILFLAFVGVLIILSVSFALTGEAKEVYKPITPAAQASYDSWAAQECPVVKSLAQAKLMDIAHGVKIEGDLNSLNQKANRNCESKGF